jgi:hypothetical protein
LEWVGFPDFGTGCRAESAKVICSFLADGFQKFTPTRLLDDSDFSDDWHGLCLWDPRNVTVSPSPLQHSLLTLSLKPFSRAQEKEIGLHGYPVEFN